MDTLVHKPIGGAIDVDMSQHILDAIIEVISGLASAGDDRR